MESTAITSADTGALPTTTLEADTASAESMASLFVENFGSAFIEAVVLPLVKERTNEIVEEMRAE